VWVAKPALEKIWYNLSVKLGLSGWSGWRWRGLGNWQPHAERWLMRQTICGWCGSSLGWPDERRI